METKVLRIGLFGTSGSGKSTTSNIMTEYGKEFDIPIIKLKLADPLYEAQSAIYKIADQELSHFYQQDGELLNFLGYYLRKLNPTVLLDRFARTLLCEIEKFSNFFGTSIIVCDDLRATDAAFLRDNDFMLVRIIADDKLCEQRRMERGDRSLGSASHITEQGLDDIEPDFIVYNNSTKDQLRVEIENLLEKIIYDPHRVSNSERSV